MPLDDDLLARARQLHRPSVEALFEGIYPSVHRIAHALTGREDVARGVLRFVMARAPRQLQHWRDIDAAQRWFLHHTVLTARRAAGHQPKPEEDLLVAKAPGDGTQCVPYIAFIRALRRLPIQQREAFILHHGEHLIDRSMAIAMDCSTKAAEQHLKSAEAALEPISGGQLRAFSALLSKAVANLTPGDDIILPSIRTGLAQLLWRRRLKRILRLLISLLLIAAAYLLYTRFHHLLPWPATLPR
jgi:DNA-directed RNA polymerase specialized sigma24 family protein